MVKLLLTLPNKENLTLDVAVEINKAHLWTSEASSAVKSMEIVVHSVTLVYTKRNQTREDERGGRPSSVVQL